MQKCKYARHAAVRDGWVGLREKVTMNLNPLFPSSTSLRFASLKGWGRQVMVTVQTGGDLFPFVLVAPLTSSVCCCSGALSPKLRFSADWSQELWAGCSQPAVQTLAAFYLVARVHVHRQQMCLWVRCWLSLGWM